MAVKMKNKLIPRISRRKLAVKEGKVKAALTRNRENNLDEL